MFLTFHLGAKKWNAISDIVGTRTGKQCRERYMNHLDPQLNDGVWTKEEDEIIIEAQKEHGNSWTMISTLLNGRTANSIKNRWYSTLRRNYDKKYVKRKRAYVPKPKKKLKKIKKKEEEITEEKEENSQEKPQDDEILKNEIEKETKQNGLTNEIKIEDGSKIDVDFLTPSDSFVELESDFDISTYFQ